MRDSDSELRRPFLRVRVFGNSMALWVAPGRQNRRDRTYAELIEAGLVAAGFNAVVDNLSAYNEMLPSVLCRFEKEIRPASPDVVILHFGGAESWSRILPWAVHKFFSTWHVHPGWGRHRIHRALGRHLWPKLRDGQTAVTRLLGERTYRIKPRRYGLELRQIVQNIKRDAGALVIVVGLASATDRMRRSYPDLDRRTATYNATMRWAIEGMNDVHFVDCEELTATPEQAEKILGDALHLSLAGHQAVAERILPLIVEWAEKLDIYARSKPAPSP